MDKQMIKWIAIVIVIGGLAFYGGMKYGQGSGVAARGSQTARGGFGPAGTGAGQARGGANLAAGTLLSVDKDSAVVKLRAGGSKIIRFSAGAEIMKTASGTPSDLVAGQSITVTGTQNSDGSLTAQLIQIRPNLPGGR